jgi:hypothetical protein
MWTWLLATAGSIAFFNYIRIGKQPRWLQHQVAALVLHHKQNRAIPNGRKRRFHRVWLIKDGRDDPPDCIEVREKTSLGTFLVQHNTQFQEEFVHR